MPPGADGSLDDVLPLYWARCARSSPDYIGMWVSIRSNIRTAAAVRSSLNEALRIATAGGARVRPVRRRDESAWVSEDSMYLLEH